MNNEKGPSAYAIVSLVTGLVGMSLIPIIFGSIDLVNIKNGFTSPRGKGFDIAGIVLGSLRILLIVALVIFALIWAFSGRADTVNIFSIPFHNFRCWR